VPCGRLRGEEGTGRRQVYRRPQHIVVVGSRAKIDWAAVSVAKLDWARLVLHLRGPYLPLFLCQMVPLSITDSTINAVLTKVGSKKTCTLITPCTKQGS
jgi:hypothetical protein